MSVQGTAKAMRKIVEKWAPHGAFDGFLNPVQALLLVEIPPVQSWE